MNRLLQAALVSTATALLWGQPASAQVSFDIDAEIPASIARELKRHGIDVPKERIKGRVEIREGGPDGIDIRFGSADEPRGAKPGGRIELEPAPKQPAGQAAETAPSVKSSGLPPATSSAPQAVPAPSPTPQAQAAAPAISAAPSPSPASPAPGAPARPEAPPQPEQRAAIDPSAATPREPAAQAPGQVSEAPSAVLGDWLVADGSARINIQPCGPNLCGTVVWAKSGDRLGAQILRAMKPAGDNRWEGTIFDPRSGRTYESKITLRGSSLRVEGCMMGLLCGGETWTRS
ncbi:MAG TPA: DUF2147 domain-containing protein [Microvirga sp.]|jgi:hypothetical protein|nr:DUF2147 domain-containing protein [Microvirga sp.]